jgi:hypothetical protein
LREVDDEGGYYNHDKENQQCEGKVSENEHPDEIRSQREKEALKNGSNADGDEYHLRAKAHHPTD